MKYAATLLLTAVVGVFATGETLSENIPKCAVKCLNDGLTNVSDCKSDDALCFCFPDTYYATYDAAVACVLQSCGNDVAVGEVLPAVTALCGAISPEWQTDESEADDTTTSSSATTSTTAKATEKLSTAAPSGTAAVSGSASVAPSASASVAASGTAAAPSASSEPADSSAGRAVVAAPLLALAAMLL